MNANAGPSYHLLLLDSYFYEDVFTITTQAAKKGTARIDRGAFQEEISIRRLEPYTGRTQYATSFDRTTLRRFWYLSKSSYKNHGGQCPIPLSGLYLK